MIRKLLATTLVLGGMLTVAHADTWVFRDTLRLNGHERSMAAKRADGVKCGAARGGHSFSDAKAPDMQQCMSARGWALDPVIPDPPRRHARSSSDAYNAPVDNSSNDDWVRRQQDQDNTQQMLNTQQMINNQQMQNDQMSGQQQQQMINDMNR
jgi:hypothetical protein